MIAALASPLARWAVTGGLLIALAAGLYIKGRVDGSRLCDAAEVRAELAQARADLGRVSAAAQDAHAASERLAQARKTDLEKIDAYEATLANRDPCALSDADVDRLRDILNGGLPNTPRRP
jgi:hypothetical protein